MSGLPEGWAWTTLESVAVLTTGSTPSTKNEGFYGGDIPFVKPGDLDRRAPIQCTDQSLTGEGAEQARLLRAGAVLVSCIGTLGKVGIAGVELASNQQINAAEFRPNVTDDRYGYYVCRTFKPWMESEASATTIAILNKGRFGEAPFPLAPLAEQKRIADKLDSVLARVDACRDRLDRIPALLKRFRQSVLAAACSGRLSEDWRQGGSFSPSKSRFENIVTESMTGLVRSTREQSSVASGRKPYLKMNNIGEDWGYDDTELAYVECSSSEQERYCLLPGDWLFNTRNSAELVGKSCVWNGPPVVFNNNLLRVRFKKDVNPWFIEIWFRSPGGRKALAAVKSATTSVAAIYQRSLMAIELDIPRLEEQQEIVRRVETLFAFADRLEARCAAARKQAGQLTPALLAKAFRGELVPQDPADEPAAELLKRLAARRAEAPKARRGRKPVAAGE